MEEDDNHSLLQPLIPFFSPSTTSSFSSSTTTTSTTFAAATCSSYSLHNIDQHHHNDCFNDNPKVFISDNSIILRILLVLVIAIISVWANYEASKTFDINIVNDAKDSLAGRRFDLSYVSNDKATHILLNASSFVQHLLYPNNNNPGKHIHRVTFRLTTRNLNATAAVYGVGGGNFNAYVIDISTWLLEEANYNQMNIVGAIQRAMARVWLWDGQSRAPPELIDGMAEYIAELAGFSREWVAGRLPECEDHGWWEDKDPRAVAHYLHYCEGYRKGFIQRLNEALRDTWHDKMVDDVLGIPAKNLCGLHNASRLHLVRNSFGLK